MKPWSWSAVTIAQPKKIPSTSPSNAPKTATMIDSHRTEVRTCLRDIPTARSSPISRVRSTIDSSSVFMMPSSAMKIARNSRAKTRPRIWLIWVSNWALSPLTSLTLAPGNCFATASTCGRTSWIDEPRSRAM